MSPSLYSSGASEARLAADVYWGLVPVDAEHLMVKANVMEEVEKEFQAQVRLAWNFSYTQTADVDTLQ